MQPQAHSQMHDNGHEIGESSSSNAEMSTTKSSKPKPSMRVGEGPTSSATSTITGTPTASGPHPQSSRKHSYPHDVTKVPNHNQNQPSSPTTPNINNNQFLLEQQIKLTQLHQLQQLQHHIFQQQMALISGQSAPMSTISPGSTSSELVGVKGVGSVGTIGSSDPHGTSLSQQQSHDGETQSGPHAFSGLPTPAHSGEIRPMDYNTTSPPMMNLIGSLNLQHIEPLPNSMIPSSNLSMTPLTQQSNTPHRNSNTPQRYGHRHSSSLSLPSVPLQTNRQDHASYPSSPSTFNQNSISPAFHPVSPIHIPISHPYHRPSSHHSSSRTNPQSQLHVPRHLYSASSPSTPISAPSEGFEFSIYGVNRSGNASHPHSSDPSPRILGSDVAFINRPGGGRGFGHAQQLLDLDQDISPLTSPWLGATVSASGGTAVATPVQVASNATGALIKKVEASQAHSRKTSVSGNKRTASESGDEGDAWSRGGTNKNSRKRPVLGSGGRTGSFGGPVASNVVVTPGLVGSEKEKRGEKDDAKNRGSTSPLTRNSTSPASEIVSSPIAMSTTLAREPAARDGGGSGSGSGHLNGGSSHTTATAVVNSMAGSIPSRGTRRGSRSTSSASTPLLRSPRSTTNLLSPMSPFLAVGGGGTGLGRREGRSNQGQGQELNSPSPVDLNLEVGQGQDRTTGRSMPPPPLPRGGVDVDMNSTEPTSPMDESSGHLQHGMLSMGGMGFDNIMSLDDGMNVGIAGIGMGDLGAMGMGLDGMNGMDMGSMGGIGGMSMEEMTDMGMNVNMGGMGGFGNGHEDSHHLEQRREEFGIMGMGYGRDHDEEENRISSSSSSAVRTNAGNATMGLATHQQHRPQSHLQHHPEYQQAQPHLSPVQTQHTRQLSHQHSLQTPQMHELQTEQSQHHLQSQLGQNIPANQPNQQQPVMPVATPSSILNLGRLGAGFGGRLGSASSASTTMGAALNSDGTGMATRAKKGPKTKDTGGPSNGGGPSRRRSLTTSIVGQATGVGLSPALKPLRPAAATSESTLPSPELNATSLALKAAASGISSSGTTAGSTCGGSITATPILGPTDGVIRQPKRTHRDAEQRRRNSQKQVIDELRQLLPPIALPSDAMTNGDPDFALGLPGTSPFFFQPIATLLPGGLPPRGPPKTGIDGPNKSVSKLQVLLCGNEYIKMLKARVERRDDEIGRLRREVKRLRSLRGDEEYQREEEELDLEKDLDAVERLQTMTGKGGSSTGESSVHGSGSSMGRGGDAMDEDDDEGDG